MFNNAIGKIFCGHLRAVVLNSSPGNDGSSDFACNICVIHVLHPRTCLSGGVPFCVCALLVLLIFSLSLSPSL